MIVNEKNRNPSILDLTLVTFNTYFSILWNFTDRNICRLRDNKVFYKIMWDISTSFKISCESLRSSTFFQSLCINSGWILLWIFLSEYMYGNLGIHSTKSRRISLINWIFCIMMDLCPDDEKPRVNVPIFLRTREISQNLAKI